MEAWRRLKINSCSIEFLAKMSFNRIKNLFYFMLTISQVSYLSKNSRICMNFMLKAKTFTPQNNGLNKNTLSFFQVFVHKLSHNLHLVYFCFTKIKWKKRTNKISRIRWNYNRKDSESWLKLRKNAILRPEYPSWVSKRDNNFNRLNCSNFLCWKKSCKSQKFWDLQIQSTILASITRVPML